MYGFWPLIWVFAVPLLLALKDKPLKVRLGYGVFWGSCAYGLMTQGLIRISPAGFLAFVVSLSCQVLIFSCFFISSRRWWVNVIYFPLLWCISELLRNKLLGGFSFYISHAHAFCPVMLKLYGTVGCLGMSFIIILVNALLYVAVIDRKRRVNYLFTAIIIFLSVVAIGVVKKEQVSPSARHLRISIIQGNISPTEKMDAALFDRNVGIHLTLTEQSYQIAHPNLVIWPETAFPDDLLQSDRWLPVIKAQALHMNADLLMGIAPIINGKEYNSALLINAHGQMVGLYHKQALVPFSETTPFSAWGIDWGRGYHISPGNRPGVFALGREALRFGVVICSESANPGLVAKLRREGADFLVEISNDGWFNDRPSCLLHSEAAVMRAVENHWWVIRVANTGFSFAVDPDGVIHTDMNIKLWHEGFGIFDIMVNKPS